MSFSSHDVVKARGKRRSYSDSDVADTTIILGKSEASFVETWAERKARRNAERRAAAPPLAPGRKPGRRSGIVAGSEKAKIFAKMWIEGESTRAMAIAMGIGMDTVVRIRKRLGFLSRRIPKTERAVMIRFDKATLDAMEARRIGRYRNVQDYVRALIRRDLNL